MKIFILKKLNLFIFGFAFVCMVFACSCSFLFFNTITTFDDSLLYQDPFAQINSITSSDKKVAYLTFDDGPTISATPKVLDVLKTNDVKATFFVIGKRVDEHPELVKRAYDEGHFIANHTYNHDNSSLYKSSESFNNEIKLTDASISKAIGVDNYSSHIFRFPNGFMAPAYKSQKKQAISLLADLNYTYVDWNCLNNDSMGKYSSSQLINNLASSCNGKGSLIVLMHDTTDVSDSSSALQASIDLLKSKGYCFKNFYEFIE